MAACLTEQTVVQHPKLERIETNEGTIWRVSYAGMVREHRQEWQARVFLQQALQQAAMELRRPEP
jgi:hypothetical protein